MQQMSKQTSSRCKDARSPNEMYECLKKGTFRDIQCSFLCCSIFILLNAFYFLQNVPECNPKHANHSKMGSQKKSPVVKGLTVKKFLLT